MHPRLENMVESEQDREYLREIERNLMELFDEAYLTSDQFDHFPSVEPNVHTNTGVEEVNQRFKALEALGYVPINDAELTTGTLVKKNGKWRVTVSINPEARSEIITAFAIVNFIYIMIGTNTGLREDYELLSEISINRLIWRDEGLKDDDRQGWIDTFLSSLMENRVDTIGWAGMVDGQAITRESKARKMGRKVNADGKLSISEIREISKRVLDALRYWKGKNPEE